MDAISWYILTAFALGALFGAHRNREDQPRNNEGQR